MSSTEVDTTHVQQNCQLLFRCCSNSKEIWNTKLLTEQEEVRSNPLTSHSQPLHLQENRATSYLSRRQAAETLVGPLESPAKLQCEHTVRHDMIWQWYDTQWQDVEPNHTCRQLRSTPLNAVYLRKTDLYFHHIALSPRASTARCVSQGGGGSRLRPHGDRRGRGRPGAFPTAPDSHAGPGKGRVRPGPLAGWHAASQLCHFPPLPVPRPPPTAAASTCPAGPSPAQASPTAPAGLLRPPPQRTLTSLLRFSTGAMAPAPARRAPASPGPAFAAASPPSSPHAVAQAARSETTRMRRACRGRPAPG